MEPGISIQQVLFQSIKERIPNHVSCVHDISELLGISYDSAYRRIRGEKELTISELQRLCAHYQISLDTLFCIDSSHFLFRSMAIGEGGFSFPEWLQHILAEIRDIHACKEKEIIYSAKDIPIFHYFEFPEIFAFKSFFWHKVLFSTPGFEQQKYPIEIPEEVLTLIRSILSFYNRIPTIELWNEETFNSLIQQIEFCYVCGYFSENSAAQMLLDQIVTMVDHLEQQASTGFRYLRGEAPDGIDGTYRLYCNEILLGDNTIYVSREGHPKTFLTYNVINLLTTENPLFCKQIEISLHNLTKKSTLISSSSERERQQFFMRIYSRISRMRERLSGAYPPAPLS